MTTVKEILDGASAQLHGWGSTADRITPLTNDITDADTTFEVDFTFGQSVGITPGMVEIDSEQLYVVNVDANANTCTVANGFGRGFNGTTAAAHTAGSVVTSRPRFPRIDLFNQLNEVVGALYPQLFVVNTATLTVTSPSNRYSLSDTLTPLGVLDAEWQDPNGNWCKCPSYTLDPRDGTFVLGGGPLIGRPLKVLFTTAPVKFASEADNFTVSGLPDSCVDLLKLGVVAYLTPGLDISRAQLSSVEQSDRSRVVPPNAGVNAAKYIQAEFQQRLANEAASLRRQYPPRLVRI